MKRWRISEKTRTALRSFSDLKALASHVQSKVISCQPGDEEVENFRENTIAIALSLHSSLECVSTHQPRKEEARSFLCDGSTR
eukprot:scaffold2390_cov84-Cylindrotheca_fusiformis.AAC.1